MKRQNTVDIKIQFLYGIVLSENVTVIQTN
jgi:hypothetical protein